MIYLASSWRNVLQPRVVSLLRGGAGHEVYDFRNPAPGNSGFNWSEISPYWTRWSLGEFVEGLTHEIAVDGFSKDMDALNAAEATILLLPCGKSAHLELGYSCGQGKPTAIFAPAWDPRGADEPELMYSMVDLVTGSEDELLAWVARG